MIGKQIVYWRTLADYQVIIQFKVKLSRVCVSDVTLMEPRHMGYPQKALNVTMTVASSYIGRIVGIN